METTRNNPVCVGQVNQGSWCQEAYEAGSPGIRDRARELRRLGYHVLVVAMGLQQVTPLGRIGLTMLDIRPGANVDTCDLPPVERV